MFEGGSEKKVPRREIFTGGGPVNFLAIVFVVKHGAEILIRRCLFHDMKTPPLMSITAPLTNPASSEAK